MAGKREIKGRVVAPEEVEVDRRQALMKGKIIEVAINAPFLQAMVQAVINAGSNYQNIQRAGINGVLQHTQCVELEGEYLEVLGTLRELNTKTRDIVNDAFAARRKAGRNGNGKADEANEGQPKPSRAVKSGGVGGASARAAADGSTGSLQ